MRKLRLLAMVAVLLALTIGIISTAHTTNAQEDVKLELWTFIDTHTRFWNDRAARYKEEVNPNFELEVIEMSYSHLPERLLSIMESGGEGAPDLADIAEDKFSLFLPDPGFLPLDDFLAAGGYDEQLVAARQMLFTYDGITYGINHNLAPVVYYYRADIWEEAGFDPQTFETWDDFIAAAEQIVAENPGVVPLPFYHGQFGIFLRQRGGDFFDAEGNVAIDSELAIDTMNWLLDLQERGIAAQAGVNDDAHWAAFRAGKMIGYIGADWYAGFLKDNVPELEGLWKAAPLPAWKVGGCRTSVWGGTGITIIASGDQIDAALDFVEFAMLTEESNVRRFELTGQFPAYIPAMDNELLHIEDPYFSGQDLAALFAELGPSAPPQYQSPFRKQLMDLLIDDYWQDIVDRKRSPRDAFTEIANEIRHRAKSKGS